jgi:transposase
LPNVTRRRERALSSESNLVERFFNVLKHFRAIATRYFGLARNFLAGFQLAVTITEHGVGGLNWLCGGATPGCF